MALKKKRKTKEDKRKEEIKKAGFQEVKIDLSNVFHHLISQHSSLLLRVDRLQKTVDAIGELLAKYAIKKS